MAVSGNMFAVGQHVPRCWRLNSVYFKRLPYHVGASALQIGGLQASRRTACRILLAGLLYLDAAVGELVSVLKEPGFRPPTLEVPSRALV